ncbi:MAG: 4-aminobutyrate--2-oxoglutarate transaminase [Armatimonadota bacterium]|nr:4-aminobutyrate--2-oxoglutarate transaminase [Armatimonadota bacterium]MDR7452079.1 4-aminobutyrate--2-oxoglutarate transaminase [Armatimonadota bacterium]MDR7466541.1 4-aminobutyrate--2-oxoglutarate transaminase [Armatimonadota bacterium]MDR7493263.1 4-aminobutyrate--2-oxoglutarate transaminase [Armatimonadota bacterium]MDR7499844.1 4-aminobutyrate--2-oxoglutarate transaminase [Armatimonadota bacterium]
MPYANVVTRTLPGPKSKAILAEKERYVSTAIGIHLPAVVERAEGALLHDVDGNTFIDLSGGVGCLNVGHSHPRVVRAITEQAARFTHTDFSVMPYEPYVRLCETLCRAAPGPRPKKAVLFNSGAEAVENAVKIARAVTGRPAVIAFEGAFHGRTYMSLSLTSKIDPYKRNFGPFMPEVYRAPFPDPYRSEAADPAAWALRRLEHLFVAHVQPDRVAAIVVEPVLGEGGFIIPPAEFLPQLRQLADRYGILLVVDEIQTGFGRTGRMFAVEHYGVEPDLMTVAKSIAVGLPVSAVVGVRDYLDALPEGALGGTYVGNPVACAAALAVFQVMAEERLVERTAALGARMVERFRRLQEKAALVGDVRGLGAMVALELVRDRATKEPAPRETLEVIRRAMHRGVLLLRAGLFNNVVRLLAPLVISDAQLEEALGILEATVLEVAQEGTAPRPRGTAR